MEPHCISVWSCKNTTDNTYVFSVVLNYYIAAIHTIH